MDLGRGPAHAGPLGRLAGQAALFASGWDHDVARRSMFWCQPNSTPAARNGSGCTGPRGCSSPQGRHAADASAQSCLDAVAWCRTDREAVFVLITALRRTW